MKFPIKSCIKLVCRLITLDPGCVLELEQYMIYSAEEKSEEMVASTITTILLLDTLYVF